MAAFGRAAIAPSIDASDMLLVEPKETFAMRKRKHGNNGL
jgi:hypothetical protein